jgi:uncharacterized protein YraI
MSLALARQCLVALSLLLPVPALAQFALTTQAVNVRAGPDRAFPMVTWLPTGTRVTVVGCTEGWQWCDVVLGRSRGWVHSRYLSNGVRSRAVPVVTFSVTTYWDTHYRGRPWYADRSVWVDWGTPSFQPPPTRDRGTVAR